MGTCETGVLRCFDARHEASMRSEWLYTYECRRRHAADTPIGPLKKEIPRPGITGAGGCGRLVRRGCGAPGCGAGFGRVQFSSIYQLCIVCVSGLQFIMYCTSWPHDFPRRPAYAGRDDGKCEDTISIHKPHQLVFCFSRRPAYAGRDGRNGNIHIEVKFMKYLHSG